MLTRNHQRIAWVVAVVLVAMQAFVLVHGITPHTDSHTAYCHICAHGSGLEDALPKPAIIVHAPVISEPSASFNSQKKSFSRYYVPTARAPPATASV
jgi:hypothetical protein